jgi:hypothetical protein
VHDAGLDIDVAAAQLGQLTEPQAHQDANSTMTRYRSGIAATSASSSASVAGWIRLTRLACPPPRTRLGLAASSSSATAVASIVRSRP